MKNLLTGVQFLYICAGKKLKNRPGIFSTPLNNVLPYALLYDSQDNTRFQFVSNLFQKDDCFLYSLLSDDHLDRMDLTNLPSLV